MFDPVTGLVTHSYGTTRPSGQVTDLTASLVFQASTAPDADSDGLPDDVEFAIGTDPRRADTDRDGLDDFAAVQQGLDPLGATRLPNGVIATLPVAGEATAVAVVGSTLDPNGQTAYVAAGSGGLAVVNATQFARPAVLSQFALPGVAADVAVDPVRGVAAVALGANGLALVDVADPAAPALRKAVSLPGTAAAVQVYDGFAYVAAGTALVSVDLTSGEVVQSLGLNGGDLVGLARENAVLFALDAGGKLRAVDVSDVLMVPRGAVVLPAAGGKLTVGNGLAVVGRDDGFNGGFSTVDVSDPAAPVLLSGPDANNLTGTQVAGTGSGVAVGVGGLNGIGNVIQVFDLSDPTNTGKLVTQYKLAADPRGLALGAGLAFVAAGGGGLQVVNYLGFDTKGKAPAVAISSPAPDVDPGKAGVQVVEGARLPVRVALADDVQVRNVELLVDDTVVANQVSLPFDFAVAAPALAAGKAAVTVRVRATDTGGNGTLSAPLAFDLVPDVVAPAVTAAAPAAGSKIYFVPSLDLRLSEPIDGDRAKAGGITLTFLGADGAAGGGDDVPVPLKGIETRGLGRQLSVFPAVVPDTGKYRLTVPAAAVADRAGNKLAADFTLDYSVLAASDIRAAVGFPAVPRAPSANVGQEVTFRVPFAPARGRLRVPTVDSAGQAGTADVAPARTDPAVGTVTFRVPDAAATGDVTVSGVGGPNAAGTGGKLDPNGLGTNWVVTRGSVDLHGEDRFGGNEFQDLRPGNGYYLDLDGSTGVAGRLESKATFALAPGEYALSFRVAGRPGGGTNTATVSLGGLFTETFTRPQTAPFETVTRTVAVTAAASARLAFDQAGGDFSGLLLDDVRLTGPGGRVLLSDDFNQTSPDGPLPLQIVPTLTGLEVAGADYQGGTLYLGGTGFVEGGTTIRFADREVVDTSPGSGPDIVSYDYVADVYRENGGLVLTVPADAPVGPVTVTTAGGTAVAFPLTFAGFRATAAASGTPADPARASANPGQAVTLAGTGFSRLTAVVFPVADDRGVVGHRAVRPLAVSADGTELIAVVPADAVTGPVRVAGDRLASAVPLQVVPVVADVQVTSASGDGKAVNVRLRGAGFIDTAGSKYTFGTTAVTDDGGTTGPNVFYGYAQPNDAADLTVPGSFTGAVTVTTAGGTSAPYAAGATTIEGAAARGTPADAGRASANPGQAVTLVGTRLTTETDVVFGYTDGNGAARTVIVRPAAATPDGTRATLVVPPYANGVATLDLAGAARQTLQVVPLVLSGEVTGAGDLRVRGLGFVEGASTYTLANAAVVDDKANAGPNVGGYYVTDNDGVDLTDVPAYGRGRFTVTTAGGTSAPADLLAVHPARGRLNDVAANPSTGTVFTATDDKLVRIDPATGAVAAEFALPGGPAYDYLGLQALPAAMTLNGVAVPAGSLLVTNGYASPDRVYAVNPADGTVLASRFLAQNLDARAGLYRPADGLLYLLIDAGGADVVVRVDPATGAEVSRFTAPFDLSGANALALDPTSGNLLAGGYGPNALYEFTPAGAPVRATNLDALPDLGAVGQQRDYDYRVSGLAFGPGGELLAASDRGAVFAVPLGRAAAAPAVTGLAAAAAAGTPAAAGKASANVGQVVELAGTGFRPGAQAVFPTRDADGAAGSVAVTAAAVSADGTRLQVVVPPQAASGPVGVAGGTGAAFLQVVPTVAGLEGRPGGDGEFRLLGSGFMEGASTVTVGGVVLDDVWANEVGGDVVGSANGDFRGLRLALGAEGPVTVRTAGGWFTLAGPADPPPAFVELTGLVAAAAAGLAADPAAPAANPGQTVTLVGRGFTAGTLVRFPVVDAGGVGGFVARTGTPTPDGTRLAVAVPALAVSGAVRVVGGDPAGVPLQVVPVVRGVGGVVGADGELLLSGAGLGAADLSVTVDGLPAAVLEVRTVADRGETWQLVRVRLSAGVGTGVVRVSTGGGSSTHRPAAAVPAQPDLVLGPDTGDTLAAAADLGVDPDSRRTVRSQSVGDVGGGKDVDLYRLAGRAGEVLTVRADGAAGLRPYLRLFDAAGKQAASDFGGAAAEFRFALPADGTYYVGVSGWANTAYDPAVAQSGSSGETGPYTLTVTRLAGASTSITQIDAVAAAGTPARAGVAAANPGQVITLRAAGLTAADRVVFPALDAGGTPYPLTVPPASVAADGASLTVAVPDGAATGAVRLERDDGGVTLQIVPTLTGVTAAAGRPFRDGTLYLSGAGFVEGDVTVRFGGAAVADRGPADPLDVNDFPFDGVATAYRPNGAVYLTGPAGVPTGPVTVSTAGGTSAPFGLTVSALTGTAGSGTPADPGQASANPGQTVTLTGTRFTPGMGVVVPVIDDRGRVSERVVRPAAVAGGTTASFVVPVDAVTGDVEVVGDVAGGRFRLQVVPVVGGLDVLAVASDGGTVQVRLRGAGFADGAGGYTFGGVTVDDPDGASGPDVFYGFAQPNDAVNLTVPATGGWTGPVVARTAGGTSAPFAVGFSGLTAAAGSGTPADPGQASANPGQTVTLTGTGLTTDTDVLLRYHDSNGAARAVLARPTAATGATASLTLPTYLNGAFAVQVAGSPFAPLLQIVPVLVSATPTGADSYRLRGLGFVEGNGSEYDFAGAVVVDASPTAGPNVGYFYATDNDGADVPGVPVHGAGVLRVRTSGGTSAGLDI